jgi:hypothetical protein
MQSAKTNLNRGSALSDSVHADDLRDFSARLRSVSEQARKLLAHVAELAYHGRGQERKPDVAYLPELHESCGLDPDGMYVLLKELASARLIEIEDKYPFEDMKIATLPSGWNALAAIASAAQERQAQLREILANVALDSLQ